VVWPALNSPHADAPSAAHSGSAPPIPHGRNVLLLVCVTLGATLVASVAVALAAS
jgi:hypothetical protein